MPGTLFVVATPIGNLEDISARALRVLAEVALIAAEDTRRTARLLARYAIRTPTTSLHAHNEYGKARHLVDRLLAGQSVALVSDAGTPALSDPGAALVRAAVDAGVGVEAIPGPSAVTSLLSVAGLAEQSFVFLGFPPTRGRARRNWFSDLCSSRRPSIFFEAPHRIRTTLATLIQVCGDRQIIVGREMTKIHGEVLRGRASEVMTRFGEVRGELTVIVEIGHKTQKTADVPPGVAQRNEKSNCGGTSIGLITEQVGSVNRFEVAEIAKNLGLKTNDVYSAILKARQSVK